MDGSDNLYFGVCSQDVGRYSDERRYIALYCCGPSQITPDTVKKVTDGSIIVDDIPKESSKGVYFAVADWRGTLVHGLLWRYPDMKQLRNHLRPGIVHRLDATTSGLMVVARRQPVMEALQQMFQERQVTKQYLALVHGMPARSEGTLSGPIARDPDNPLRMAVIDGGRPALTGYRVLWSSPAQRDTCRGKVSLVVCSLFTVTRTKAPLTTMGPYDVFWPTSRRAFVSDDVFWPTS